MNPMYAIIAQAAIGLPFVAGFVWLVLWMIIYGVMAVDDRNNDQERTRGQGLRQRARRIRTAAIAATVICILIYFLTCQGNGPVIN